MRVNFVMLQLKMGGGNRVFTELIKGLTASVDCHAFATRTVHESAVGLDPSRVHMVGYNSPSLLSRAASLVRLVMAVACLPYRDVYVYSDPVVAVFMAVIPKRKRIRYMQADDYTLFAGNPKMPLAARGIYRALNLISFNVPGQTWAFSSKFVHGTFARRTAMRVPATIINPGISAQSYFITNNLPRGRSVAILARKEPVKGLGVFEEAIRILGSHGMELERIYYYGQETVRPAGPGATFVRCTSDAENRRVLNKADLFVFPSLREGYGLPPLEAMACGCLVVAADCGGVREYGRNGYNLLMCRPGDPVDLARAMAEAVSRQDREEIRRNGVKTAEGRGWDTAVAQVRKLLETA